MTAPGYTFVGYRIVDGKQIPMVEPIAGQATPVVKPSRFALGEHVNGKPEHEPGQVELL